MRGGNVSLRWVEETAQRKALEDRKAKREIVEGKNQSGAHYVRRVN